MIYVGIDDTDTLDSPGTNKLCKAIVKEIADRFECMLIIRHQLLDDPRVPYTSQNGSASVLLKPATEELANATDEELCQRVFAEFRAGLQQRFVAGSDPGLCVTTSVPEEITEFALKCQNEVVKQAAARELASKHQIRLEGLGGTEDGVIGALAAVGLAAKANDGRIVQMGTWPDDLNGLQSVETVRSRNVLLRDLESTNTIDAGIIDVGKHLRPNYRGAQIVLFAKPAEPPGHSREPHWEAVRFP